MPSLTPESRFDLLSAIRADQSARWQRGEAVHVEYYFSQYPELAGDPGALIDLVYAEILLRLDKGESPSLVEYLGRFPAHAEALRLRWQRFRLAHPELRTHVDETGGTVSDEVTTKRVGRPLPAYTLPGFELFERLGEGGMGVVFRARDTRLDQPRAIKVIRTGPFAGEQARERFNTEAKAVARLDHPGVVRIFSLGEHDDVLFICMELLEGGSLQQRLRQGRLEVPEAAELVRQLALAVQHAHDAGVLHRDLKPGNVLLSTKRDSSDGKDGTNGLHGSPSSHKTLAKVGDFGLAKLLDADDGLTHPGAVMGTPSYMAPEQAEGSKFVGPAADIYALGAILYECLTGKAPFKGESRSETLALVKSELPVPPRQLRQEVPADLEAICLKCLEKEPACRYATAGELARDLMNWQDGSTVTAHGSAWRRMLRHMRRWTRTHRRHLSASLFLGLLVLAGTAILRQNTRSDPLAAIQKDLHDGKSVVLIGATGPPLMFQRWHGGENVTTTLEEDRTFSINGWKLTLLELLPQIDCGRYRIHAEVRHLKGFENSEVGLFFAGRTQQNGNAIVHSCIQVSFDDVHDRVAQEAARLAGLPAAVRAQMPVPKGNRVKIDSLYFADGKAAPLLYANHFQPELFKPAGNWLRPGAWRKLTITVSQARARVQWNENALVGELDFGKTQTRDARGLAFALQKQPANPVLSGLNLRIDPHGGIGLYLFGSSASFRNVRIEPLAAADNNQ